MSTVFGGGAPSDNAREVMNNSQGEIAGIEDDEDPGKAMGRVLAFSDGVFAFAITLLVLSLSVAPNQSLQLVLPRLGSRSWETALSFALVGRFWILHRRIFARIRRPDEVLVGLNLVFLSAIVAMPFATQLLAHPGRQPIQVIVFAGTIGAAALLATCLWTYAWTWGQLVDPQLSASPDGLARFASGFTGLITALVCLVSIAVAAAYPTAGELVWVAFLIPRRWTVPWFRPMARRLLSANERVLNRRRLDMTGRSEVPCIGASEHPT